MPPETMFGTTRKSVTRQSFTDGTSTIWLRACEYAASTSELRREDAVVPHRLVVAAELVELAVLRRVLREQRRGPLRPVVAVRRIAEERRVEVVVRIDSCHVPFAEYEVIWRFRSMPPRSKSGNRRLPSASTLFGALKRPRLPARIDRAEEEQPVLAGPARRS